MMEALIAIFGIVFGIGGPVLVVYLYLLFSSRKTAKKLDTLVKMVEHGATIDPEALSLLTESDGPVADMRRGLVWLAIGIPLTLAVAANEGGAQAAYALIPVFIGAAYLIMVKVGRDRASGKPLG